MEKNYEFKITQVVAAENQSNAIGYNGQLLWHLPEDLRFFKNLTWGMPVIMGRRTYASINKPLPGRTNIVLTRSNFEATDEVAVVNSIGDALAYCDSLQTKEVFVIGGSEIYNQFMPFSTRIYFTRVFADIKNADAFFPEINKDEWTLKKAFTKDADDKNSFAMQFETWERKAIS